LDWSEAVEIGGKSAPLSDHLKTMYLTMTDAAIAETISRAVGQKLATHAVTKKRQMLRLEKTRNGVPRLFEQDKRRYTDPPVIEARSVLVMADVHAPYHDADFCSELVDFAKHVGIKTVLLAGDFLDFTAISTFTPAMLSDVEEADETDLVSDEIVKAAAFCDVLLDNFARVVMILGNHEERLTRRLAVQTRVTLLRHLLGYRREERFEIYPYYYALIKDGTRVWRVTHPKNYSVIPVRVAARLADKYQQEVIAAHGHDWGETISVSGRYACSCGMCADAELIEYTQLRDSLNPFMQTGAWVLVDGEPLLLHPTIRGPVAMKGHYGKR